MTNKQVYLLIGIQWLGNAVMFGLFMAFLHVKFDRLLTGSKGPTSVSTTPPLLILIAEHTYGAGVEAVAGRIGVGYPRNQGLEA
jgi:hypothetical protein